MTGPTAALVERLLSESPIGPAEAARLYGSYRRGRPTHHSTIVSHITQGVRISNGAVLRLEGVRIGGRLVTSRAAVVRFIAAQQGTATASPVPGRTPAERTCAAAAAAARLTELGM